MKQKILGVIAVALTFATSPVAIAADAKEAAPATIKTVFVNGKGQRSFAEEVNKIHAEMAAQGWKFADLDLYVENGDMQGAFVSYTR